MCANLCSIRAYEDCSAFSSATKLLHFFCVSDLKSGCLITGKVLLNISSENCYSSVRSSVQHPNSPPLEVNGNTPTDFKVCRIGFQKINWLELESTRTSLIIPINESILTCSNLQHDCFLKWKALCKKKKKSICMILVFKIVVKSILNKKSYMWHSDRGAGTHRHQNCILMIALGMSFSV